MTGAFVSFGMRTLTVVYYAYVATYTYTYIHAHIHVRIYALLYYTGTIEHVLN